jgi:hypothetical protein
MPNLNECLIFEGGDESVNGGLWVDPAPRQQCCCLGDTGDHAEVGVWSCSSMHLTAHTGRLLIGNGVSAALVGNDGLNTFDLEVRRRIHEAVEHAR